MNFKVFRCPKCQARGQTRTKEDSDGNEISVCQKCKTEYTRDEFRANFHLDGDHPAQQPKAPTAPPPPPPPSPSSPPTIPATAVGIPTAGSIDTNPGVTFAAVKAHYEQHPELYPRCPCCVRKTKKLDKYSLNRAKLIVLFEVAQLTGPGAKPWIQFKREGGAYVLPNGREVPSAIGHPVRRGLNLCIYGLLERVTAAKFDNMYRVTQTGSDFLAGKIKLPAYMRSRDGEVVEWATQEIKVAEVPHVEISRLQYAWNQQYKGKDPGVV